MARNLSYLNRYFVMYPNKATVKIWRKVTRKSGRMHIWQLKMQELPGPQPILAHFTHLTLLRYICKISGKISAPPPLTRYWIRYWLQIFILWSFWWLWFKMKELVVDSDVKFVLWLFTKKLIVNKTTTLTSTHRSTFIGSS